MLFLSTPSGWRATPPPHLVVCPLPISIRALRVEDDARELARRCTKTYFYPRPPGGGRRSKTPGEHQRRRFLSTPSGWRATLIVDFFSTIFAFLSTPSGWRATCPDVRRDRRLLFLSTPSGWRATAKHLSSASGSSFLSTPSGWRATAFAMLEDGEKIFLSTLSGWRATGYRPLPDTVYSISIHALRVEGDALMVLFTAAGCSISIHALRVEGD